MDCIVLQHLLICTYLYVELLSFTRDKVLKSTKAVGKVVGSGYLLGKL